MKQLIHWWLMGGYSLYVWSAYGLICLAMIIQGLTMRFQRLRVLKRLEQWFKRNEL